MVKELQLSVDKAPNVVVKCDLNATTLMEAVMYRDETLAQRLDLSYRSDPAERRAIADRYRAQSAELSLEGAVLPSEDSALEADRAEILSERLDLSYRNDPSQRRVMADRYRARAAEASYEQSESKKAQDDSALSERLDLSYRSDPTERRAVADRYRSQTGECESD